MPAEHGTLPDLLIGGLAAPICLTWELTYGCNLACVHCLSSSGQRDPAELTTAEAHRLIEELASLSVFYVNMGGGEPTLRRDFFELVEHAASSGVGVKFSTNGTTMTRSRAERIAALDYVDVQISLDGARPETNDLVRGPGSHSAAVAALGALAAAGVAGIKLSVVVTRHSAGELAELLELAQSHGAELRLTRLRPSGRGAATWSELRPSRSQLVALHGFLTEHPEVLTADSFFHLSPLGSGPLPGLNLCGAGRVVCLVDPLGDVYACPFVMHPDFKAGSIREAGGFTAVWRDSEVFSRLRVPSSGGACNACDGFSTCHGGCMAAKFFTGLPLEGPDPECVRGHGEEALSRVGLAPVVPVGHSRPPSDPVPVLLSGVTR